MKHALICHLRDMMVPFVVVSRLQYRTHELLRFTWMKQKERLCQQGVLLRHKHTPVSTDEDHEVDIRGSAFPTFTCRVIVFKGLFCSRRLKHGVTELHRSSSERLFPSEGGKQL